MDCSLIAHENIAERYLHGNLPPEQLAAYEQHFFECDDCFGELQRLRAIREALQTVPKETPEPVRGGGYFGEWWRWPAIAAVAASAVGAALLLRQHEAAAPAPIFETVPFPTEHGMPPSSAASAGSELPDPDRVAPAPDVVTAPPASAASSTSGPTRAERLARLARVDPPRYDPPVMRGMQDMASTAFREGMKAYTAGDYDAATVELRKAAALDSSRPDIGFYLSASELLAGRLDVARTGFEQVIALGETAFTEEARFYLANTLLRQDRLADARLELGAVIQMDGPLRGEAERLVEELSRLESATSGH